MNHKHLTLILVACSLSGCSLLNSAVYPFKDHTPNELKPLVNREYPFKNYMMLLDLKTRAPVNSMIVVNPSTYHNGYDSCYVPTWPSYRKQPAYFSQWLNESGKPSTFSDAIWDIKRCRVHSILPKGTRYKITSIVCKGLQNCHTMIKILSGNNIGDSAELLISYSALMMKK